MRTAPISKREREREREKRRGPRVRRTKNGNQRSVICRVRRLCKIQSNSRCPSRRECRRTSRVCSDRVRCAAGFANTRWGSIRSAGSAARGTKPRASPPSTFRPTASALAAPDWSNSNNSSPSTRSLGTRGPAPRTEPLWECRPRSRPHIDTICCRTAGGPDSHCPPPGRTDIHSDTARGRIPGPQCRRKPPAQDTAPGNRAGTERTGPRTKSRRRNSWKWSLSRPPTPR